MTAKIKNFFSKLKLKDRIILICCLALLGIILISVSGDIFSAGKDTKKDVEAGDATDEYKLYLEKQLKETLEKVEGVGSVELMITFDGEISKNVIYNETTSSSGNIGSSQSERTTKEVVMEKNTSGSAPYYSSEIYPNVTGVIVVAQGANDPQTKANITEAVKVALGVAAHKIVVLTKDK